MKNAACGFFQEPVVCSFFTIAFAEGNQNGSIGIQEKLFPFVALS